MTTSDKLREIVDKTFPLFGSRLDEWRKVERDKLLSDLTALISEHYYPKEFLLWTGENCQYYPDTNEWMYFESPMTQQYFKGTDELFNYWANNEK
jgi:hypothetical protein